MNKMKNEDKLVICKKYFYGGFAFLPFLWFINSFWFFKEAFRKPFYAEQKQIKTYVLWSMLGSFLWLGGLVAWNIVFHMKRVQWGELGEDLSFILPKGRA